MLVEDASYARYLETGHLVFARGNSLMAAPFDSARLEVGPPVPIIENVMTDARTGAALFTVVDKGLIVYAPSTEDSPPPGGSGGCCRWTDKVWPDHSPRSKERYNSRAFPRWTRGECWSR